jgi:hypothetical protein
MVLMSAVRQPPAPAPDGMEIEAMTAWLTASVSPNAHDRRMMAIASDRAIGKGHPDG